MATNRQIFDVSARLDLSLVTWPGVVEGFERRIGYNLEDGDPMTVSHFQLGAHAGTHVDAPCHFIAGAGGIEEVPLEALVGDAYVVEIPGGHRTISADVLAASDIPIGTTRLLAKTANSGWSRRTEPFREDYVAFDESAADWCLARNIRLVGIDYLSVEPFDADARGYPVHKRWLGAGLVILESIDLTGVNAGQYELVALPLLVPGSDGAPARAILIAK